MIVKTVFNAPEYGPGSCFGCMQTWNALLASRGQTASLQTTLSKCHKVMVLNRSETLGWWKQILPMYTKAVVRANTPLLSSADRKKASYFLSKGSKKSCGPRCLCNPQEQATVTQIWGLSYLMSVTETPT